MLPVSSTYYSVLCWETAPSDSPIIRERCWLRTSWPEPVEVKIYQFPFAAGHGNVHCSFYSTFCMLNSLVSELSGCGSCLQTGRPLLGPNLGIHSTSNYLIDVVN